MNIQVWNVAQCYKTLDLIPSTEVLKTKSNQTTA